MLLSGKFKVCEKIAMCLYNERFTTGIDPYILFRSPAHYQSAIQQGHFLELNLGVCTY